MKRTYQSTFGFAMMRRVKHLFLLSVPWYLRASALSLAWSTAESITPSKFESEAPSIERSPWSAVLAAQ